MKMVSKLRVKDLNLTCIPDTEKKNHPYFNETVLLPFKHALQLPFEPSAIPKPQEFISCFNSWLNIPDEKLIEIAEIVHWTSVLLAMKKDIEEDVLERQGFPTTHQVYGIGRTSNTFTYASLIILRKCFNLKGLDAVTEWKNFHSDYFTGVGMEYYWCENLKTPTEKEYKRMIGQKTCSFYLFIFRLMGLFSASQKNLLNLTLKLGEYVAILNDYQQEHCKTTPMWKYTISSINALTKMPEENEIINAMKRKSTEIDVKKYLISVINERGGFNHSLKALQKLYEDIHDEINILGGNEEMKHLLEKISWKNLKF